MRSLFRRVPHTLLWYDKVHNVLLLPRNVKMPALQPVRPMLAGAE